MQTVASMEPSIAPSPPVPSGLVGVDLMPSLAPSLAPSLVHSMAPSMAPSVQKVADLIRALKQSVLGGLHLRVLRVMR